jgi:ATP-dependent DNA ligase
MAPAGIEGILVKVADSRYRPGEPGWTKYKSVKVTSSLTLPS